MASDIETLYDFFIYMSAPPPPSSIDIPFPTNLLKNLLLQHLYDRDLSLDDLYLKQTGLLEPQSLEMKCLALSAVCGIARTVPVVEHKLLYDTAFESLKELFTELAWSVPAWMWQKIGNGKERELGYEEDELLKLVPNVPEKRAFVPHYLIGIIQIVFSKLMDEEEDSALRNWIARFTHAVVGEEMFSDCLFQRLFSYGTAKYESAFVGSTPPDIPTHILSELTGRLIEPCIGCRDCEPVGERKYENWDWTHDESVFPEYFDFSPNMTSSEEEDSDFIDEKERSSNCSRCSAQCCLHEFLGDQLNDSANNYNWEDTDQLTPSELELTWDTEELLEEVRTTLHPFEQRKGEFIRESYRESSEPLTAFESRLNQILDGIFMGTAEPELLIDLLEVEFPDTGLTIPYWLYQDRDAKLASQAARLNVSGESAGTKSLSSVMEDLHIGISFPSSWFET